MSQPTIPSPSRRSPWNTNDAEATVAHDKRTSTVWPPLEEAQEVEAHREQSPSLPAVNAPEMPPKVALDPLLGQIVDGRYEIQTLLGEGGMGKVYKVRHVALQRHFAMKVLRKELAADRELALRFEREARAAARV